MTARYFFYCSRQMQLLTYISIMENPAVEAGFLIEI